MKRLIVLCVAMVALVACEKEPHILTMDDAVRKVQSVIKAHPNRDWYASKSIVEPGTVLQYSFAGVSWDAPERMHEFISPDYRAWLIVLAEDYSLNSLEQYDCLHLFVNAETGKYEQLWLSGRAVLDWGSDPYSRYLESLDKQ